MPNREEEVLTKEQIETAHIIIRMKPEKVVFFKGETPGEMGCELTEDGLTTIGFFGEHGKLVGNWQ